MQRSVNTTASFVATGAGFNTLTMRLLLLLLLLSFGEEFEVAEEEEVEEDILGYDNTSATQTLLTGPRLSSSGR